MSHTLPDFTLPAGLIGSIDISRMIREIEAIDGVLESQKAQGKSEDHLELPSLSRNLADFAELNKVDLLDYQVRMSLKKQLKALKEKGPFLHLTFSTIADHDGLQELATWVRKEIHPLTLIAVGLQPALIGGVYVRTPAHVYDLSMRAMFANKTDTLVHDLEELAHEG